MRGEDLGAIRHTDEVLRASDVLYYKRAFKAFLGDERANDRLSLAGKLRPVFSGYPPVPCFVSTSHTFFLG